MWERESEAEGWNECQGHLRAHVNLESYYAFKVSNFRHLKCDHIRPNTTFATKCVQSDEIPQNRRHTTKTTFATKATQAKKFDQKRPNAT